MWERYVYAHTTCAHVTDTGVPPAEQRVLPGRRDDDDDMPCEMESGGIYIYHSILRLVTLPCTTTSSQKSWLS
jgi:hypothetical protein